MAQIRRIRLSDRFYLPRRTYSGQEIVDAMPWDGGESYVTDGERYGILMQDGSVRWLEESRKEQFAEDFAGVDLDAVVAGLQEYAERYQVLKSIWREDLETLKEIRDGRDPEGSGPDQ